MPTAIKAPMLKGIVFDWAGTMIDFGSCAPVEALVEGFSAEGVALTMAQARRDMGRAKRDHVASALTNPEVAANWMAAKGQPSTEADIDRIYEALGPLMIAAAARHTDLIPGAAATLADVRARGIKVGSNTGYTRAMMVPILAAAAAQGYVPDAVVCAGETAEGRPSPLMVWKLLVELGVYPASACVKVDDAEVGIGEGRSAGCWTVGVAASGNGVGLTLPEYEALDEETRRARIAASADALSKAGAHYVIDTVADLPGVLDQIEARMAAGEKPEGN
ncbi:phosphonoacetaldehyde hydrolase [Asticcacaulis solisilvae]|uniref:phosphonoacetaldehyde hydrolase n=1 Tax=Asticcacaulis solisilvae TaxID=1217274 RepID=UPI003FD6F783